MTRWISIVLFAAVLNAESFRWDRGWGVRLEGSPVLISISSPAESDIWLGTTWNAGAGCNQRDPSTGIPYGDCTGEPEGMYAVFIIHVRAGQRLGTVQKLYLPAEFGSSTQTLASPPGAIPGDWIAVEFHPGLVKEPECEPQEAPRVGFHPPPGFIRCKSPVLAGMKPELRRIEEMQ